MGDGLDEDLYAAARGALAAAQTQGLDARVLRRCEGVLASARAGTLVDELREGERGEG